MKNKRFLIILLLLCFSLIFSSCSDVSGNTDVEQSAGESSDDAPQGDTAQSQGLDTTFSARDLDAGFDESNSTKIIFSNANVTITGSGAANNGGTVTISKGGTYILSGSSSDAQIIVNTGKDEKVQLVFNSLQISSTSKSPVYIKQSDKVFITLAENTKNTLSDAKSYTLADTDDNLDAAIFSKEDLTINGSGTLSVSGNYKHGIVSKDDLIITGGTINVTSVNQALSGKDVIKIKSAVFNLTSGTDAVHAQNDDDTALGNIYVESGTFNITAECDAFQAQNTLQIDGGTFTVKTGGGSANASSSSSDWGQWGSSSSSQESKSAKGFKTGVEMIINSGTFSVDSSDDSFHSNNSLTVTGGTFTVSSGDDGFHADDGLIISGGAITIKKSYEGLEGKSVTITGGNINITASDDGINAAGGNDQSSMGARPGANSFSSTDTDVFIKISGGKININASGDGIDSNSNIYIDGGETYVSGSESGGDAALDYDGTASVSGGILVAAGKSGMAQGFSSDSSQCSFMYNFSSNLNAGEKVSVKDSSGNIIVAFTPAKGYNSIVVSSPELKQGESVTIEAGSVSTTLKLTDISTGNSNPSMGRGPR